jgi:hypothetical protein
VGVAVGVRVAVGLRVAVGRGVATLRIGVGDFFATAFAAGLGQCLTKRVLPFTTFFTVLQGCVSRWGTTLPAACVSVVEAN